MLKRFALGFGVGYVLGARAGQERYEQITSAGKRVADHPAVRQLADRVPENPRETVTRLVSTARERLGQLLEERSDSSGSEDLDGDADEDDDEDADEDYGEDEEDGDEGEQDQEPGGAEVDDEKQGSERDEAETSSRRQGKVKTRQGDGGSKGTSKKRSLGSSLGSSLGGLAAGVYERGKVA